MHDALLGDCVAVGDQEPVVDVIGNPDKGIQLYPCNGWTISPELAW